MTNDGSGGPAVARCVDATRTFGAGAAAVGALRGVTCQIAPGRQLALTGPSGSGKSTLLHLLAGLDEPTTGTVTWPAIGARDQLRPGPVAVVFQGPSLLPPLDVMENVALPLILGGAQEPEARAMAAAALQSLGLSDMASKLPEELSGGQAQRVAVARVLAGRPQLILADEPTGQLDHTNGRVVVEALIRAATSLGAALVLSTHDPKISKSFASRWQIADGMLLGSVSNRGDIPCSA